MAGDVVQTEFEFSFFSSVLFPFFPFNLWIKGIFKFISLFIDFKKPY